MNRVLEPQDRQVYWEPLTPPPGYELHTAVAVTYSLDLQALMMACVPMAFGSLDLEEGELPDQVQALAALQRVARKTTVFCQQAQIAEPKRYSRLFSMLEPVVAEVNAPGGGVFHPKLWLARYTGDGEERYTLMVLSRNLTLDRSWDVMLSAQGRLTGGTRNFRKPLSDFFHTLPNLCSHSLESPRRDAILELADLLPHVKFARPEPVSRIGYRPTGIRKSQDLDPGWADRRLVISPFLSDNAVNTLFEDVGEGILISRQDSLDRLKEKTLEELGQHRVYYWFDQATDVEADKETEDAAPGAEPDAGEHLQGLHAKIIVTERGDQTRVLVGSANATDAAFHDHNVEFCAQLRGDTELLGIDQFFPPDNEDEKGHTAAISDLVMPYDRGDDVEPLDPDPVEEVLREVRREVMSLDLQLSISQIDDEHWTLTVTPGGDAREMSQGVDVKCRPISREHDTVLKDASRLWRGEDVTFEGVSLETLTTFMLFKVGIDDRQTRFVMNLPIHEGVMPEKRQDRLIARMIEDSDGFLRYLLMLLWEDEVDDLETLGLSGWMSHRGRRGSGVETLPLLEEMVDAFSKAPERLDEIDEIVTSLMETDEGRQILPRDFIELWEAFKEARSGLDA